ncbi:MAG: TrmJ/YjtD family RNA methyltransferase [Spirochaetaceae bacterium]|nr:TrmJ/YjtD family RNA methyltransferase [Spirochaetaceae bacterium]
MKLEDVVVVLCRPSEPGNVGAVCRAMKNMGLVRLRLVSPENMVDEVVRARAVHAEDVWAGARFFGSLGEAVADCSVVVGTSRRRGKRRKGIALSPREAARFLGAYPGGGGVGAAPPPAALVFGNERTGLENDELALCTFSSDIPANGVFPSLNLSHAVQIYAYELFMALDGGGAARRGGAEPVPRRKTDALCDSICDSLEGLGFYTRGERGAQHEFFRDVFSRAALTEFECGYMDRIFRKAARLGAGGRCKKS